MKIEYTGKNREGFYRDARMLLESKEYGFFTDHNAWDDAVRDLAKDYNIETCDIWDYLAEITV